MPKYFPHSEQPPRKSRRSPSPPLVPDLDPIQHRLRVEAEQAERDRVEAERARRMAERHALRETRKVAWDETERLAKAAFPWSQMPSRQALAKALAYTFEACQQPHASLATSWSMLTVFGPIPEVAPPGTDREVLALILLTCPFSPRLSDVAPMIELLAHRVSCNKPDFDSEGFQQRAWASAAKHLAKRTAMAAALRAGGIVLVDLGDGWFSFDPIGKETTAQPKPGGLAELVTGATP